MNTDADLELSVVIPCLNEARTIAVCIERAIAAMAQHGIAGEVVVSDNGSTDGSIEVARAAGARVVNCPTRGYGAAIAWGFRHARGRYFVMGDADQSYDFALVPRFVDAARKGSSFVMGSRLRGQIEDGAMPPLHRYLGTPVLTKILNVLFGTRISDCNCGMRLIERKTFFTLGVVSPGMEFASEMIVKAAVVGVDITEVPIDFFRDRRDRRPHLRPFSDGWRHLRLLLWHAPDQMMTLPGLVMLAMGLLLAISQLRGKVSLGFTNLDIHYMILGVTLALVGTSATTLGLVIGATMPAGRVKHVRLLKSAHEWYSFDRAAVVSGFLFALGCVFDGYVLAYWLYHDRGTLTTFYTRLTLFGLLLIAMSVQIGLSALLFGASFTGTGRLRRSTDLPSDLLEATGPAARG